MLARMWRASVFLAGLLGLLGAGCAANMPVRATVRAATEEERGAIGRVLVPLLITSNLWSGPADGCGVALKIVSVHKINLGVAPHPQCKFALVITDEALGTLSPDELQAALAHEIGHVQLGHFGARRERRSEEKKTRAEINEKGSTSGALVTAIPIIGPLLAVGIMSTQAVADSAVEEKYRAYDRGEEQAADRYGLDLLQLVIGRVRGCQAEVALLERLTRERAASRWSIWLNTHPSPSDRLKVVRELCPA
jgi:peptidase M48-like protein